MRTLKNKEHEGMKYFLLIGALCLSFMAGAKDLKPLSTQEMEGLVDYIGERLEADDVNCSNIDQFIESYFALSTANQLYLTVFAQRFLDTVDEVDSQADSVPSRAPSKTSVEDPWTCMGGEELNLKDEIACAVGWIEENAFVLADQAHLIKDVMSQCLSSSK